MKRLAEDKRVRRIYSDSASGSDSDHSSVKRDKKDASVIMPKAATANSNTFNELNWSNSSVVRVFPHHYIYVRDLTTNVTRLEVGPQTFVRKDNEQVSTCTHLLSKQVSQAFFSTFLRKLKCQKNSSQFLSKNSGWGQLFSTLKKKLTQGQDFNILPKTYISSKFVLNS